MSELITTSLDHLRPWMAWAKDEPLSPKRRLRLFATWDRYWASGEGAVYGVFLDGQPIGGCALHRRAGPGGLDIGYWLGAGRTGHGHATRIATALTTAACIEADVHFVEISHEASNTSSGAVAERLGYTHFDTTSHGAVAVTTWRYECSSAGPSGPA